MTDTGNLAPGPDRTAALEQYRQRAGVYDLELALFEPLRRQAISRLGLQHGDCVLDIGCGTGLSLALLRQAVGIKGRIIGIEQCPEMIEHARERVERQQLGKVTLLRAPVESAALHGKADAALFHFTHDILIRPDAVANVVRHLRPGARVVACGLKWAGIWVMPVNFFVWGAAMRSVTSMRGLQQPWMDLAKRVADLRVETMWASSIYIASGQIADPIRSPRSPKKRTKHCGQVLDSSGGS